VLVVEAPEMAGAGDEITAGAGSYGTMRASHDDRDLAIEVLKAAFVQGRLDRDEFVLRVGRTLASRTYAELADLTADILAGLARARPPESARERLYGPPPCLQHLPRDDRPLQRAPLLTQPFAAGMTGWVVVLGAVIAELLGGAAVANTMSAAIAVPVLIFPIAVAFGFAVVQWRQVRSRGVEPASRWHLTGIAAAALTWLLWPTVSHDPAWWFTGALILIVALLARRSRIAAWAAIPAVFAGCELATHFLH
jgi:Domain of unknown function (DUF1707)